MSKLDELKAAAKAVREQSAKEKLTTTATESDNLIDESFVDRVKDELAGNTSMPPVSEEQGFAPLIEHIGTSQGFTSAGASQKPAPATPRPATKLDLRNLTEADILDMPYIKAKGFDVPALLQVTPKEDDVRFRWVNFKNYEGGNYGMFRAMGFVNAVTADVKGNVADNLIAEDGAIKFFDVVLMKINVVILMQHYKKNILSSQRMVNQWRTTAKDEAEKTLKNSVPSELLDSMRRAGLTVEFYNPSGAEMSTQDKDFAEV